VKGPKPLISDPFLGWAVTCFITERDDIPWIHFVVIDNFPIGVSYRGPDLQALILLERVGSATTRRGILGRGLLTESVGTSMLGERLGLSRGTPAGTGGTDCLMVLGALFMSHDLQKGISEEREIRTRMLGSKRWES
jgi:hypothetical protein